MPDAREPLDPSSERWYVRLDATLGLYHDIYTGSGSPVARLVCFNSERVANEIVADHNARLTKETT